MAVLLISMAIAAVWMAATLPAWRHQVQREKETELIFRGEQYAKAIARYYHQNNTLPQDIDVLVSQHFLRKKWKDPITNDDFVTLMQGQAAPGTSGTGQSGAGGPAAPGRGPGASGGVGGQLPPQGGQAAGGGISGVASKSTATSIKTYGNQTQHNLWSFNYQPQCLVLYGTASCSARQGGPGGGPGGRGGPAQDGRGGPGGRQVGGPGGPVGPGGPGGPGGRAGGGPGGPPPPGRGGRGGV